MAVLRHFATFIILAYSDYVCFMNKEEIQGLERLTGSE